MKQPRYESEMYLDIEMPSDDMDTNITGRKSKLVKKRKPGICCYCLAPIPAGDYCVAEQGFVEEYEGYRPFRIYYCLDCVDDEIRSWQDDDYREEAYRKWEERYERWKGGKEEGGRRCRD